MKVKKQSVQRVNEIELNIDPVMAILRVRVNRWEQHKVPTFMFAQEVNAFLQYGGLVHFPGVARQHRAKLLDEDIELVSAFLLWFVTGHATIRNTGRQ